ncbi:MAG TPA: exodeoxyribonuclease VII small subunit [Polyangiaceae bacterium]|nr:exodeoxyribonuclease VII small subunit [Polyangiaceae bacterium]
MTERKAKKDPKAGGDFEASVRRLGEIVEALEAGDLPLEESLKLFEEGVGLARTSQKVLDNAEQRVEQLLSVDAEGNPVTKPLDD